jgi:hypothetical protein
MRHLGALLVLPLFAGCGENPQCKAFAEHLADVVAAEKDETVDAEVREKMVKKTTESCVADAPSKAALDCALAAESSEAMKQCDEK